MKLDKGYISPYFITDQKNQKCELENPLILIHEKKISSINVVFKVLELALKGVFCFEVKTRSAIGILMSEDKEKVVMGK
ncbi:hypothetical protein Taro_047903, partial [Colocasia esculenta]|nr:hypothetical protein [Colocasia esculenta]